MISTLSKKKEVQLYNSIHQEIMNSRIELAKILHGHKDGVKIDGILSYLNYKAPQKAIELFKKNTK